MQKEPVFAVAAILSVVSAGLTLLIAFGFNLTADQVTAILGFANPVLILVAAVATRNIVWAPATVDDLFHAPGHPES